MTMISGELKYEVIIGVRRLYALRHLGVKTTPVIIKDVDDAKAFRLWFATNIHYEPLNERELELAKELGLNVPISVLTKIQNDY